jgi:hypothetical protein
MGYFSEQDLSEQEDESRSWQQKQDEEMEFADYLFQLQRDDELIEKMNEIIRMECRK